MMSSRYYSVIMGGSLGKEPPHFAMCVLIKLPVTGVDLEGGSLSSSMLKVDPHLVGKFEVFLRATHLHPLFLEKHLYS